MKEPNVRILLYSWSVGSGPERLLSTSLVPESLAHDELRDLLHSVGVESPERAILEGPPVFDGGLTNQIRWVVEDLECPDHWHCDPKLAPHGCDVADRTKPCPTCGQEAT